MIISNIMEWYTIMFNNIVAAVVIILIGFIIGRVIGKLIRRILNEAEIDKIIKKTGISLSLEKSLSQVSEYGIYLITIIIALNQLGIMKILLYVLAVSILLIIVISLLLSIKDFIPNFIAGLAIKRRDLFKKGDRIKINGMSGIVSSLSFLETRLTTSKNDIIIIPNSIIMNSKIVVRKSR